MSIGFGVFLAFMALGAGLAGSVLPPHLARTARRGGEGSRSPGRLARRLRRRSACWLGYSTGAQFLAAAASLLPLRIGRRYLPASIAGHLGGNLMTTQALDIEIHRKGRKEAAFQVNADPANPKELRDILTGWLAAQGWDKGTGCSSSSWRSRPGRGTRATVRAK